MLFFMGLDGVRVEAKHTQTSLAKAGLMPTASALEESPQIATVPDI